MSTQNVYEPDLDGCPASLPWLSAEEQAAWRLMVSFHARLTGRLDDELRAAHGLSLRDYEVLAYLSEADGFALRMAELAERLVVSPSGLTRRLDGLVRAGLVRRQACLSDKRGSLAVLSTAGRAALQDAAPTHVAGVRRHVFDPLNREQLRQLTASMRALSARLDAESPRHEPSLHG